MSLPEPYYQSDDCIIYHGDCREIVPHLEPVDLLLTDPPYGISWNTNHSRFTNLRQSTPRKDFPAVANDDSDSLMQFAINWKGERIVWGAHLSPWNIRDVGSWLVWDKRFDNGKAFLADGELAWWSKGSGTYIHSHTWQGMIGDRSGKQIKRKHPNQKPVGLMRWCLSLSQSAATVLDVCMGSGTTLLAARLEGRKAIGIELEERYCEIAAERLRQGVLF